MADEWKLCVQWLQSCRILTPDFSVRDVSDLAQALRDGVLLCHLVNYLKPGTIDQTQFNQRPQLSQVGGKLMFPCATANMSVLRAVRADVLNLVVSLNGYVWIILYLYRSTCILLRKRVYVRCAPCVVMS